MKQLLPNMTMKTNRRTLPTKSSHRSFPSGLRGLLLFGSICCLLTTGCQSASLSPSKLSAHMFGPSKKPKPTANVEPKPLTKVPEKILTAQEVTEEFQKGEMALREGKNKEAKKHFVAVVQNQPDNAAAHHRLAYIADKAGEFSVSKVHYITAMRIEPRNADIICDLGYSCFLQNQLEDSARYLEKALAIDPNHEASLLNLASLKGKQGDYNAALALFRQAGSEDQAQANIARLFPNGPPDGTQTAMAQNSAGQPPISPETQDLQRKLAAVNQKNNQAQAAEQAQEFPAHLTAQNPPRTQSGQIDWSKMDPREIPPDKINEVFTQIDQQGRGGTASNPSSNMAAQQPVTGGVEMAQASSVPGELPTTPQKQADPYGDYAVVQMDPAPNTGDPAFSNAASELQSSPYFGDPNTTQPAGMGVSGIAPVAAVNSTPKAANTSSSPSPAAGDPQYQAAIAMAMQMGMNAGPGQMFPLKTSGTSTARPAKPAAQPTASKPSLLWDEDVSATPHQAFSETANAANEIQQISGTGTASGPASAAEPFPMTQPSLRGAANPNQNQNIADWPFSPQQTAATTGRASSNTAVKATGAEPKAAPGTPPWFDAPLDYSVQRPLRNEESLPVATPGSRSGHQMPQQWPHSPQISEAPTSQGMTIHRGSTPAETTPSANMSSHSMLPQVIPGTR